MNASTPIPRATNVALRLALVATVSAIAVWIFQYVAGNDTHSGAAAVSVYVGINAAVAGIVFVGPLAARGAIAWAWAILALLAAVLTLISIGLVLFPAALAWIVVAVRQGRPSRGAMMLSAFVVGVLGWAVLGIALWP